MILASLIFGSLDWAWAAATLGFITLAILVWGYRRTPGSVGTRCVAAALKAAGVAMLALCLIEPRFSSTRPRPGANIFVILADDSQSLQIRDPGREKNRAQLLHERLADGQPWRTRLQQDFDVRRYRFDERLRSLDDPAELTGQERRKNRSTRTPPLAFPVIPSVYPRPALLPALLPFPAPCSLPFPPASASARRPTAP